MRKLPVIPVILALVTLGIIIGVYLVLKEFQRKALYQPLDVFAGVPADSETIIHFRKPSLLAESFALAGPLAGYAEQISGWKNTSGFILRMDSVMHSQGVKKQTWDHTQLVVSFQAIPQSDQKDFMIQVNFPTAVSYPDKEAIFREIFPAPFTITPTHNSIYRFESNSESLKFYFTQYKNALLISSKSQNLLWDEEHGITGTKITSDSRFETLRSSAGRFSDNVYMQTPLLCSFLTDELINTIPFHLSCTNLAGWQLWDISISTGELFFTGFASSGAHGQMFVDNLAGQQHVTSTIKNHIPATTDLFFYIGLSDKEKFLNLYHQWSQIQNIDLQLDENAQTLKQYTELQADSLTAWWNGELAWLSERGMHGQEGIIMAGINGKYRFLTHPLLEEKIVDANIASDFDAHEEAYIWEVKLPGFMTLFTGGLVKNDPQFIAFSGEYLLAAKSPEILNIHLQQIATGNVFSEGSLARSFNEFLRDGQNLFFFHTAEAHVNERIIMEDTNEQSQDPSIQRNIFGIQLSTSTGGMVFSNAMLMHKTEFATTFNPVEWETQLENPVHKGPFKVFNHNDGYTEFILQDHGNLLYLVDMEGDILWKKEISGPIMSEIFQVDIYKNNRYQYVFNTRNYLHLVDRNGNYVRGYPMRLPTPASSGIAVFDYDNNKNYRIIFAAENRRIYNYSLNRRPIQGWEFGQSAHWITQPLKHFRLKGRDYLLAIDTAGQISILDRRGLARVRARKPVEALPGTQPYASDENAEKAYLMIAGPGGKVHQVFTDGNVFSFVPDTLDGNFTFKYAEYTRKGQKDLIFVQNGNLMVYNIAARLVFSVSLGVGENLTLKTIDMTTDNKGKALLILDETSQKIFMLDSQGRMIRPFPLNGHSGFVSEKTEGNKMDMITIFESNLIKYRIQLTEPNDLTAGDQIITPSTTN